MSTKLLTTVVLLACCAPAAGDEVYRCERDGTVTYTDRPCTKETLPHALPKAIVIVPPTQAERELARQHDARIQRDRQARNRADGEWVKSHAAKKDFRERVRAAIIDKRVIKGMSADEVRRALGEPDQIARSDSHGSAKETWTYSGSGESRRVNFKNGEVSSVSTGRKKKK